MGWTKSKTSTQMQKSKEGRRWLLSVKATNQGETAHVSEKGWRKSNEEDNEKEERS